MIGIACDHNGLQLKNEIILYLNNLGFNVKDYGCEINEKVDYPDYAFKIGEGIKNKKLKYGILICKTGIGMSIACNKVKGVRCAKVDNLEEAELTRLHNDSNVIAISALNKDALEIIKKFIETDFQTEDRHLKRIAKITKYEEEHGY